MNKAAKNMLGVKVPITGLIHWMKTQQGLGDILQEIGPSEKRLFRANSGNITDHLPVSSTTL